MKSATTRLTAEDERILRLSLDAWNGASVTMTAQEWERAEQLVDGLDELTDEMREAA